MGNLTTRLMRRAGYWTLAAISTLATPAAAPTFAQRPGATSGIADSYTTARALVDSAIVAHGGLDAIRAATRFTARMEGKDVWRNQSPRVDPPYDTLPWTGVLALDLPQSQFVWTTTSGFPGGFRNANRTVIADAQRGFNANLRQRTYVNIANRGVWTQRNVLFRFPHLILLGILDDAATLRSLGDLMVDGQRLRAVTAATPQGAQVTLAFDPATRLLRAIETMGADPLAGDAPNEILFSDYRRAAQVMVPGRRVQRTAGEVTSDVRYVDVAVGAAVPDSLLTPPAGFAEAPRVPPTPAVKELAPGVWDIRAGYHALAVAFRDHMFVMEAPGGASAEIIARVKELAGGKPIRFVAPTHHHDDHAGGMRDFIAEGATIITTPGNRAYFERMGVARRTISPDAQSLRPQPVRIETISGKRRVLTDGTRTVELIDIGPSPHANEMLVAWLPAEGILFQGDLLNTGGGPIYPTTANATTLHFADWVRRSGLAVRTIAGVHMEPGPIALLEEAVTKARAEPQAER